MSKATDDTGGPRQDSISGAAASRPSRNCDAALRPHLSALVDGELEPLEAIALQQHVRQSPALETECRELERLKMAVHLAGTRAPSPVALGELLEARCRASLRTKAARDARAPLWVWLAPLGMLSAAAITLVVVNTGAVDESSLTPGKVAEVAVKPAIDPSDLVLARLVAFHRKGSSPMALADLSARGVLVTVERLPDSFIVPEGKRAQVVQASYMGCNEREGGSTLAVLRVDQVDLPQRIDNALDATGVYVDTIDGVEVRVSVSGDKLFVLLSGEANKVPSPI